MKKNHLSIRFLVKFFLLSLLILFSAYDAPPARAAGDETLPARAARAQALTQALVGRSARGASLAELRALADERRDLLAALIEEAPGEAIKTALPAGLRGRLPAGIRDLVEQRLTLEGELEVYHVDGEDPRDSRYVHVLKTSLGDRVSVHFAQDMPGLLSGTEVRAQGVYFDGLQVGDDATEGAIVLGDGAGLEVLACCGGTGGSTGSSTTIAPNTFGEQRTLVLLVNFQDLQEEPWSLQHAQDLVFGQSSDFFYENSYQQTWLSGDVFGWYTLPINEGCSTTPIENEANAKATANGINLGDYNRIVYVYPGKCDYGGTATIGGSPSRTFILADQFKLYIVAHELGHNFGLWHSHGLNCSGGVVTDSCLRPEYGDGLDAMGSRELHFNAFQKERLGWLGYGQSPLIGVIDSGGTYSISTYASADNGAHALKIFRDVDPATGIARWLYLEQRQPIGFDSAMLNSFYLDTENITNGIIVHMGTEGEGNSSFLLDMTPDSTTDIWSDLDDPALVAGQTYSDPETGVTITTEWADGSGATVQVAFNGVDCAAANPAMDLSPSSSQWVAPGTSVTYYVTVINNNDSACATATFNLSAAVPAGWTASFAAPSLMLDAGMRDTTTLDVTSDTSAAEGYYDIAVTAVNDGDSNVAGMATATYVVSSNINHPPVASDDSAETSEDTAVDVDVLANDTDPDQDPLAVLAVTQGAKGTVTLMPQGLVQYQPSGKAKGSDTFSYTVSDGLDTSVASVTVTVRKSGAGNGGNGSGKGKN